MAYKKKTWIDDEVITDEALNNMEQGIADAHKNLGAAAGAVRFDLPQTLTEAQQQTARDNIGVPSAEATGQAAAQKVADMAVRYDEAQSLSAAQKTQARDNVGAAAADHTHTAAKVTAGTLGGQVQANAAAAATLGTAQVRNIIIATSAPTTGVNNGDIWLMYS